MPTSHVTPHTALFPFSRVHPALVRAHATIVAAGLCAVPGGMEPLMSMSERRGTLGTDDRRREGFRAERGGGGVSILRHGQVSLQLHTVRGTPAATLPTSPHRAATTRRDSLAAANRRWCRPDVVSLTGGAHLCDWRTVDGWTYAGPVAPVASVQTDIHAVGSLLGSHVSVEPVELNSSPTTRARRPPAH